ncbi:MAG: PrgI family protein [Patescibacteria group bacterium]
MVQQFTVPQFIDIEDKILGPLSVRQFLIVLAMGLTDTLLYSLLTFWKFLLFGVPIFLIGVTFAFIRINGQPFHFFVLNMIQTFRKPLLRVWDKKLTDAELKPYLKGDAVAPVAVVATREPVTSSRLQELSLIVNTGGVYQPEE